MSLSVYIKKKEWVNVYDANVTHNLTEMASKAGLYEPLWRPEEIFTGDIFAKDLIPSLERGLQELKSDPNKFKKYNPKNGWGNYEGLVKFTENYLQACKEDPDGLIEISR